MSVSVLNAAFFHQTNVSTLHVHVNELPVKVPKVPYDKLYIEI